MKSRTLVTLTASILLAGATLAFAQPAPGGGGGGPGGGAGGGGRRGGGAGGGGGPGGGGANFMQQRMDTIKQELGSTDEEFAAISPKITAVMTAQRDAQAGGRGGFGGGRGGAGGGPGGGGAGGGGPGGGMAQSEVAKATAELNTTLQNKEASADEVKSKLEALRAAKAQAKEKLVVAQKELRELLQPRQEAVLVANGILE